VLLEKFPELSGDLAVVSRAHVVLFLQAMMKRTPAKVLGLMGQVDGNLSEFLRDGMGVETADDRFAPNMNGLKAFLAARQSELRSASSEEATQKARMEADGIAAQGLARERRAAGRIVVKGLPAEIRTGDRAGYLRALVSGLLDRKGAGQGGQAGLFAGAVEKWPANWEVEVYHSQDAYRRAARGEDRDGYLAVERVRNGYRLRIWEDGTDRDLHAAVMGVARALLFSRNPGMSADLNKALAVRYLEEVGKLSVEGASLAAGTQWRELGTMKGLLDDGRAGRWMTQVFVNLMAGRLGAGKEGAEAAWRQLSALGRAAEGDGLALWLASLAPSSGLVESKIVHSLAMIMGENTFGLFVKAATAEQLQELAAQIERASDNHVSLSVAMASGKQKIETTPGRSIMMAPEERYSLLVKKFLERAELASSQGLVLSPAYGALEVRQGESWIDLDRVDGIREGAEVRIIGSTGTRWTGQKLKDLKLVVDLIVFVSLDVSGVIDKLKAAIQKVRSAA
jgi:hypothetical protein